MVSIVVGDVIDVVVYVLAVAVAAAVCSNTYFRDLPGAKC